MSRKKKSDDGLIIWAFIIGVPAFLIMQFPFIFWLVFVPVVTFLVVRFVMWLKKK
jgi:hypothetical protein